MIESLGRKYLHTLLNQACDNASEEESIIGVFVNLVIRDIIITKRTLTAEEWKQLRKETEGALKDYPEGCFDE